MSGKLKIYEGQFYITLTEHKFKILVDGNSCCSTFYNRITSSFVMDKTKYRDCMFHPRQHQTLLFCTHLLFVKERINLGRGNVRINLYKQVEGVPARFWGSSMYTLCYLINWTILIISSIFIALQECLIALNFASESEANQFYKTATNTISNRSKRRQDTNSM